MDTTALVTDRVAEGRTLLIELLRRRFDLGAAAWIKSGSDERWRLYLVSPVVDQRGPAAAYSQVFEALGTGVAPSLSTFDIKLIGPSVPVAEDLRRVQQREAASAPALVQNRQFGNLPVDEAYVYPPPGLLMPSPRLVSRFVYSRQGDENRWLSWLNSDAGEFLEGVNLEGAIAYSAAHWEGEDSEGIRQATVTVLTSVNSELVQSGALRNPALRDEFTRQARSQADALFRSRHPGAVIEVNEEYASDPA